MRVLLTNVRLEQRAGSELYLLDVARWLREQGHQPVAYSARIGPLGDAFRAESIPVISDPGRLGEPPHLIHGQHHLSTMAALGSFPLTPAISLCHGWTPWEETPVQHPAIRRYVAVSVLTRERLIAENGIPTQKVRLVPNFVDLERFPSREPLPQRPTRALAFSNHARAGGWFEAVRTACEARGITLEAAGRDSGRPLDDPGTVLHDYDLVFAKGRSAIEAMAVGAAVIICDLEGCGPLVGPEEYDRAQRANFGHLVMRQSHHSTYLGEQIDRYDAGAAAAVSDLVRSSLARDRVLPRLLQVYEEAISDLETHPHTLEESRQAEQRYLQWIDRNYPVADLEIVSTLQRDRLELRAELSRSQAEIKRLSESEVSTRRSAARAQQRLAQLQSGILVGTLLPRVWRARDRLMPPSSRRRQVYQVLTSFGRPSASAKAAERQVSPLRDTEDPLS